MIAGVKHPEVVEIVAAIKAMVFARHMGFTKIMVEGDALNFINGINQTGQDLPAIGNLTGEAKFMKRSCVM